jgi:hypothetical protein
MAVAEPAPPAGTRTSWDFKSIDPAVEDFLLTTDGHAMAFTMSTIPTCMFLDADPGAIPVSPDEARWNYEAGFDLRDRSGRQVADYFARIAGCTVGGSQLAWRAIRQWHSTFPAYPAPRVESCADCTSMESPELVTFTKSNELFPHQIRSLKEWTFTDE